MEKYATIRFGERACFAMSLDTPRAHTEARQPGKKTLSKHSIVGEYLHARKATPLSVALLEARGRQPTALRLVTFSPIPPAAMHKPS